MDIKEQPSCGNGELNSDEECEPGYLDATSCNSLGYYGGVLKCGEDCKFDISGCEVYGHCGDGDIQDVFGEECDIGKLNGNSCEGFGYYAGNLLCDSTCHFDFSECITAGKCGDDLIQEDFGEECEGNTTGENSCLSLGYYGGELTCDASSCRFILDDCKSYGWCGNGILDTIADTDATGISIETCDGTNLHGKTCITLGYERGDLSCSSDCLSFNESECYSCGNGIIEPGESCDGTTLGGNTCAILGIDPDYSLICDFNCQFAGCDSFPVTVAGASHSCAIGSDGFTYCWGRNDRAQVGVSNMFNITSPVLVEGTPILTALSAGDDHTCGVTASGDAYCWGYNYYGQIGDGTTIKRYEATLVAGGLQFASVSAGGGHSCGITVSGETYCWGENSSGQLGIDATDYRKLTPTLVAGGHIFVQVKAGWLYSCGINDSGVMYCWGKNDRGQLGDGTYTNRFAPTPVSGGLQWAYTAPGGGKHTCGITTSGIAFCWGYNDAGQLGNGNHSNSNIPVAVEGGNLQFSMISTNWRFSCGTTADGSGYCWGVNNLDQLGDNSYGHDTPGLVEGNHKFLTIAAGGDHSCGLTTDGRTFCWGYGGNGQVGDGSTMRRDFPVFVSFR